MHKYILAMMTFLILLKAIGADPVKAVENPEQKNMQQRIEQHFRQEAEQVGIETEGKDLKEVYGELHIVQKEKQRETMLTTAKILQIETEGKTMKEITKAVREKKGTERRIEQNELFSIFVSN